MASKSLVPIKNKAPRILRGAFCYYVLVKYIIGIDEVGRGALAGPVAVGAVLMPAHLSWDDFEGLKDSKKLSEKKREEWFEKIRTSDVLVFAVEMVEPDFIDKEGIVHACLRAAHSAVDAFGIDDKEAEVLCDAGLFVPPRWTQKSIVRGDESEVSIALASIVAKVTRDRYMIEISEKYPKYYLAKHKGYGTKLHMDAIRRFGVSDIHRKTFCKIFVSKT
jgi:ribonuclease HII